jgi:hypothetical protein
MRSFMTLIAILVFATSSFAGEISKSQVRAFLYEWLDAQNTGSYSNYAAMYSNSFIGIRRSGSSTTNLNHDAWLKDRKNMFNKKMVVEAKNPEIKLSGTTASVKFEQIWESGTYKDKGDKLLNLALESGKLKITREEMLFSKVVIDTNGEHTNIKSKFTSTKDKDCKKMQSYNMITFFGSDTVIECPAPKGWRLFKEYDREGIRSWIRLSIDGSIWTTIDQVWSDEKYEFGYFPNVDSSQVEWRITDLGKPLALIFRVNAQNPENASSNLARLFVISLANNIPRFCGMVKTNEEARAIADKAIMCSTALEKKTLPK